MNHSVFVIRHCSSVVTLIALLLAGVTTSAQSGFVSESATEFFSQADFDGDGREDLVIVDKPTGSYRIGYQISAGNFTWAGARASGVDNVSGFSVGRLLHPTMQAIAFAGADANRVIVFDASNPVTAGLPVPAFMPSIGPSLVLALDIGGAGNTSHDDLFIGSSFNGVPFPNRLSLVRNTGGTFSTLDDQLSSSALARGNRVVLKTGGNPLAGVVYRGATDTFRALSLAGVPPAEIASVAGLPAGSTFVFHNFDGSPYSQFLFWAPGQSNLLLRAVQESSGAFTFGAGSSFTFSSAIANVFVLPGDSDSKLLLLFGDGERAAVFNFDGMNVPALLQEFTAPPGESFSGAGVRTGNNFMLYSGQGGSGSSLFFNSHELSLGRYVTGPRGNLPSVTAVSGRANVFLFVREPFVAPNAHLLRSLNAGDWSSRLMFSAPPPNVSVTAESFAGSSAGLSGPTPTSLGTAPAGGSFGLINQYREEISLFNYGPANGDEISDVTITPAPGLYKKGVDVALSASVPALQIYFRLNSTEAWTLYSAPIKLFKNTTVAYYGKPPAGAAKSRIKYATYTFSDPPGKLDSDGDGVPDYVEIARGTDPTEADSDGDGYSDFDELAKGTDPLNSASKPASTPERNAAFDLALTPRPFDGTVSNYTVSATGTVVRAYDLHGSLLSVGETAYLGLSGVVDPAARLSNIVVDATTRLIALATEPNYAIDTPSSDKNLGRELVGLVPMPELSNALEVPYTYAAGDLNTEANNWIAAAQAASAALHRPLFAGQLTLDDSLVALLFARKVTDIMASRGITAASNGVTLFSFRPSDSARFNPDHTLLNSLEFRTGDSQPGFLLQTMLRTLDTQVKAPPNAAVMDLRAVATEIYRLSSILNNTAPGVFPQPFDTLREFIESGNLHSNYLAHTSLSAGQLADARAAVSSVLASLSGRPVTNVTLRVRADSFAGNCTVLDSAGLGAPSTLFHPGGEPYRLLEAFKLVPGSLIQALGYTDVTNNNCAGRPLEVISLSLVSIPVASDTDTDGDLLVDSWAELFALADPFAHSDTDGYSNLQEMFEGTDPRDDLSFPARPAVLLSPPEITIDASPGGGVRLRWTASSIYDSRLRFGVRSTAALDTPFTEVSVTPTHIGDNYEIEIAAPGSESQFYVIYLSLR